MKRILISTALILAAAGSASAMVSPNQLSSHVKYQVHTKVPGADLSGLTTAQVAAIENIFSGSGNDSAGENVRGQIRTILNWN